MQYAPLKHLLVWSKCLMTPLILLCSYSLILKPLRTKAAPCCWQTIIITIPWWKTVIGYQFFFMRERMLSSVMEHSWKVSWRTGRAGKNGPLPSLIAFHSRKQTMEKRRKSNKTHAFCQTKTTEIGVANWVWKRDKEKKNKIHILQCVRTSSVQKFNFRRIWIFENF